jgi:hypothetical protein
LSAQVHSLRLYDSLGALKLDKPLPPGWGTTLLQEVQQYPTLSDALNQVIQTYDSANNTGPQSKETIQVASDLVNVKSKETIGLPRGRGSSKETSRDPTEQKTEIVSNRTLHVEGTGETRTDEPVLSESHGGGAQGNGEAAETNMVFVQTPKPLGPSHRLESSNHTRNTQDFEQNIGSPDAFSKNLMETPKRPLLENFVNQNRTARGINIMIESSEQESGFQAQEVLPKHLKDEKEIDSIIESYKKSKSVRTSNQLFINSLSNFKEGLSKGRKKTDNYRNEDLVAIIDHLRREGEIQREVIKEMNTDLLRTRGQLALHRKKRSQALLIEGDPSPREENTVCQSLINTDQRIEIEELRLKVKQERQSNLVLAE